MIKKFKHLHMLGGGLAVLWCASGLAHEGAGALGADVKATDYYIIDCSDDGSGPPAFLEFQLDAGPPATGPVVSAQIQVPDKQIAYNVTDPVNGKGGASREVKIPGGGSLYYLTIDKSGAGKVTYGFSYHCMTAANVHTGTDLTSKQDQ